MSDRIWRRFVVVVAVDAVPAMLGWLVAGHTGMFLAIIGCSFGWIGGELTGRYETEQATLRREREAR